MAGLVTVQIYATLPEAEIVRSMLEQHGIFAFLPDRNTVGVAWFLTQAVGGIRLQVPEEELEAVRTLLGERDDVLVEGGVDKCPGCGSGDVFRPASLIAGLAGIFFFSVPILIGKTARYCRQCRHKWRAAPN